MCFCLFFVCGKLVGCLGKLREKVSFRSGGSI